MSRTAARLVEEVVPEVPVRQWVLTLPKHLRFFLDKDRKVLDFYYVEPEPPDDL